MALPALVLPQLETKLSVPLIFVIARTALHFKNFVIVSHWLIVFKSSLIVLWQKLYKKNFKTPRKSFWVFATQEV